jgi:histidine triad (HIT) family protein
MTVFEKIIAGHIPSEKLHEDDLCIGIRDVAPQAPTHLLIIPKEVIPRIAEATPTQAATVAHLLQVAASLGQKHGPDGFRIVINNGPDGGETVPHLHVHVLAGRTLEWPPG